MTTTVSPLAATSASRAAPTASWMTASAESASSEAWVGMIPQESASCRRTRSRGVEATMGMLGRYFAAFRAV